MKKIPRNEFLQALRDYHPALHLEYYANYRHWYFGDDPLDAEFFAVGGCVVVYRGAEYNGEYSVFCYIHEVSDNCDFDEACRVCRDYAAADCARYETTSRTIVLVHCGEPDEDLNKFQGFRKFVRYPQADEPPFESDPHIVPLTREHFDEMKKICDPAVLESDTWFGKMEAESFFDWEFDWCEKEGIRLLGYRDDTGHLLGIASWSAEDEVNLGWLHDIFVTPAGRGHGIGRALVRAALSRVPGRPWLYQAARDNVPSIALAKSCGFTLDGANLFVYAD